MWWRGHEWARAATASALCSLASYKAVFGSSLAYHSYHKIQEILIPVRNKGSSFAIPRTSPSFPNPAKQTRIQRNRFCASPAKAEEAVTRLKQTEQVGSGNQIGMFNMRREPSSAFCYLLLGMYRSPTQTMPSVPFSKNNQLSCRKGQI